jgi:hypothetical protein
MPKLTGLKKFFLSNALQNSDDPFDDVKVSVLLNFSLFFFITNIPYTILSFSSHPIHLISAIQQNACLLSVIFLLKQGKRIKLAILIFTATYFSQMTFHFLINNGVIEAQGVLFFTLVCLGTYILLGKKWGAGVTIVMSLMILTGIYNSLNDFCIFRFPREMGDPTLEGALTYMVILPFLMNVYLVSEFVKAEIKARSIIQEQKKVVTEKNQEITDSLRYARRIQHSLMPTQIFLERTFEKLKKK